MKLEKKNGAEGRNLGKSRVYRWERERMQVSRMLRSKEGNQARVGVLEWVTVPYAVEKLNNVSDEKQSLD